MSIKTKARIIIIFSFLIGTFSIFNYFFPINSIIKYVGNRELLLPIALIFFFVSTMFVVVWKLDYGDYPWSCL